MGEPLPHIEDFAEKARLELDRLWKTLAEFSSTNKKAFRFLAEASKQLKTGPIPLNPSADFETLPTELHPRGKIDRHICRANAEVTRVIAEQVRDARVRSLLLELADDFDKLAG
jgi:hypothetical protein